MDSPFDHDRADHEPLDLGDFATPSPRHVSNVQRATTADIPALRETEPAKRNWLGRKVKPVSETPENPDRRLWLKGALATTALAAGGYGTYRYVYTPRTFNFALLKQEDGEYGLVHRTMSYDEKDGTINPARTSLEGLGATSLAGDGHEAIIVSPELQLKAVDRPRNLTPEQARELAQHKHDAQELKLTRTASDIYLPYHLFADASRFTISRHTTGEGKKRLSISITGYARAEDIPIAQDISRAAETGGNAVSDTLTGLRNGVVGGADRIAEAVGLGDGVDDAARIARERQEAIRHREQARAHPQVTPKFIIDLDDTGDETLPNLHFYNGQTIDAPTTHVLRETIAAGLNRPQAANDLPGFHIITNNGLSCDAFQNGGVCVPQGVRFTRDGIDLGIERGAHEAGQMGDSAPKAGIAARLWNAITTFADDDPQLNTNEMGAMVMATDLQHQGVEKILGTGLSGFANRILTRGEAIDPQIGR